MYMCGRRVPVKSKDQARRQMASRASRHGAAPPAADGGTRSDADERGARARCRRPRPTPARPAARSAALLDRARVPQQAPMPRASGRRRRRRAKSASARPAAAARHQQRRARLAAEPRAATSRGPRTSWRLMRAHMGAEHHVRVNGTRGVAGRASPPARPPPGAVTSSARAHRRDLKGTFIGRACRWSDQRQKSRRRRSRRSRRKN